MCKMELVKGLEKDIETLYDCTLEVYENQETINDGHITEHKRVKTLEGVKCRISYKNGTRKLLSTQQSRFCGVASQGVKILIPNDIEIKAGSEIIVIKEGKRLKFKYSGEEACYMGHKEIVAERIKEV